FWDRPYEVLQQFFEGHILRSLSPGELDALAPQPANGVPPAVALLRDWHAQMVELGKHHCLKTNARCHSPGKACWKGVATRHHHRPPVACEGCPLNGVCALGRANATT